VSSFREIKWVLTALAGASALLVALRALAGRPITVFVDIARPLNLESAAAVSLLLVLVIAGRESKVVTPSDRGRGWALTALGLVLLATLACYWRSLWFPFLSDDYVIVVRALRGELLAGTLTQGDANVAFRPLTRFLFAVQGWRGSADPAWWHSVGVIFHLADSALVFLLARKFASPGASAFAAAVFGLHASHPEAVSWMNSRSDVLATFFLTSALLVFLSHCRRPAWGLQLAALTLVALAVLSKESAYAFAPLAWLLVAVRERPGWKCVRTLVPFVLLEAALFAWRWRVLGGLGGHVSSQTGRPLFLTLDVLRTVKTLCWRAWAILFFPVNWDVRPALWLGLTLVLAAAGLVALSRARAERRTLISLLAFVVVALLPVLPLALVGTDLAGARLYYLPSVGVALLLGAALDGVRSRTLRVGVAAALLLFHFAALRHELGVWESVATLARRTCVDAAPAIVRSAGSQVVIQGLPDSIDGVFFLGNGFSECVQLAAGRRLPDPIMGGAGMANPPARVFRWDPQRRLLITASAE